jgi:hypothetical protein
LAHHEKTIGCHGFHGEAASPGIFQAIGPRRGGVGAGFMSTEESFFIFGGQGAPFETPGKGAA